MANTPAADISKPKRARIKVRATKLGYYDNARRREGDVFVLESEVDKAGKLVAFSDKWMERVPNETPVSITTGNQQLQKDHEDIRRSKANDVQGETATGDVERI